MAKSQSPANAKPASVSISIVLGLVLITTLIMLPYAIILAIGMLPTLMAKLIDNKPEKNITLTVGIMNICGVVPNLMGLWQTGANVGAALRIISDPFALLMMFAGAAFGWMLIFSMPPLMAYLISIRAAETISRLQDRMQQLRSVWGDSLKEAVIEITPDQAENFLPDSRF